MADDKAEYENLTQVFKAAAGTVNAYLAGCAGRQSTVSTSLPRVRPCSPTSWAVAASARS